MQSIKPDNTQITDKVIINAVIMS